MEKGIRQSGENKTYLSGGCKAPSLGRVITPVALILQPPLVMCVDGAVPGVGRKGSQGRHCCGHPAQRECSCSFLALWGLAALKGPCADGAGVIASIDRGAGRCEGQLALGDA